VVGADANGEGASLDDQARGPRLVRASFGCHYGWYNTERIQARLDWRSPDEYEADWHANQHDQHAHPAAPAAEPDPATAR